MYRIVFSSLILVSFFACKMDGEKTLSEAEKREQDSLSKIRQRRTADSLRKTNPFLIVPPDSQYTGDYVDKYENGVIKFKGFFRFGQQHGHWRSFYPTGVLWSEMHYDKGLREGANIAYYENGKTRYEGFYKIDKQDSVWTYFDTAGTVLRRVIYKNDQPVKNLGK